MVEITDDDRKAAEDAVMFTTCSGEELAYEFARHRIAARNDALDLDWVRVAKLAGEHGIRYRTNAALAAFLSALLTPSGHQEGE